MMMKNPAPDAPAAPADADAGPGHTHSPDPPAPSRLDPSRSAPSLSAAQEPASELGGPSGPEPTRYGDWERKGRCIDF